MKIIATSDWHLGNQFHQIDRLPEHRHFLEWLKTKIVEINPDALVVAGDIFDNGNPSAAAQSLYYGFLADVTSLAPDMSIIITAGNHDSASRIEAPRALLERHHVEVRGSVQTKWEKVDDENMQRVVQLDDLIIDVNAADGEKCVVLAVPFIRTDFASGATYSAAVGRLFCNLIKRAKETHPDTPILLMAHMYATGADIAKDSSERILIGGQEQVDMANWDVRPDFFVCGHIHKRQHIWNTDWARYTGSVLPMSFAEKDYKHGVDVIELTQGNKPQHHFEEYIPQHKLVTIPKDGKALPIKELKKELKELPDLIGDKPDENSVYLEILLQKDKSGSEDRAEIEALVNQKNAVICTWKVVHEDVDISTIIDDANLQSIDDVLNRNPMDALKEAFMLENKNKEMNDRQLSMLEEVINRTMCQ